MREAMWGPVGYCSSSTCSIENDESERGMIKHSCLSVGIYLRERERERDLWVGELLKITEEAF